MLSQRNCITYQPLLAEVVGASMMPGHAVAPIRQIVNRTRFWMATVTDVDFDRRELHFEAEDAGGVWASSATNTWCWPAA